MARGGRWAGILPHAGDDAVRKGNRTGQVVDGDRASRDAPRVHVVVDDGHGGQVDHGGDGCYRRLRVNPEDVLTACRSAGVDLVRFIYCDFAGVQRGKITAVDDLANRLRHGINMTRAQMAFTLLDTMVDVRGMEPVGEVRMIADPETFAVLPWLPSHASMVCDLVEPDGARYEACTRTWLKHMIERATERGVRIQAAFEPEFYLGSTNAQTGKWEPGRHHWHYAENGFNVQGRFLTDITRTLRAMGMVPEMVYHEGGPGQQEISIRHAPALRAADNQVNCATPCAAWRSNTATTPASRPSRSRGRLAAARTCTSARGTRTPSPT